MGAPSTGPSSTARGTTLSLAVAGVLLTHAGFFVTLGPALTEAFPLDDAYTHHVYAEGIRYGDGLSYLPGTPAAGSTSPLQALILTPNQLAPLPALGKPRPSQVDLVVLTMQRDPDWIFAATGLRLRDLPFARGVRFA